MRWVARLPALYWCSFPALIQAAGCGVRLADPQSPGIYTWRPINCRMRSVPRSASPVNFDSLNDHALKVREHDSMQQVRIGIGALQGCLAERFAGCRLPWAS